MTAAFLYAEYLNGTIPMPLLRYDTRWPRALRGALAADR